MCGPQQPAGHLKSKQEGTRAQASTAGAPGGAALPGWHSAGTRPQAPRPPAAAPAASSTGRQAATAVGMRGHQQAAHEQAAAAGGGSGRWALQRRIQPAWRDQRASAQRTTRISAAEKSVVPGSSVRVTGWPCCCILGVLQLLAIHPDHRGSVRSAGGGAPEQKDAKTQPLTLLRIPQAPSCCGMLISASRDVPAHHGATAAATSPVLCGV